MKTGKLLIFDFKIDLEEIEDYIRIGESCR